MYFILEPEDIGMPFRMRVKVYNKAEQLVECESVFSRVGSSLKYFFTKQTVDLASKIVASRLDGLTRIEISLYFQTF